MKDLVTTLDEIKEKIQDHDEELSKSEALTRYVLIDPLLRVLDWDTTDPRQVMPEETVGAGKTDYTLGKSLMVIEAKKLNFPLSGKPAKDLRGYMKPKKVRYGALTDGRKWFLYDAQNGTNMPVVMFDVADDNGIIIPQVSRLHRLVISRGGAITVEDENGDPEKETPLDKLEDQKDGRTPAVLVCPNGEKMKLNSWAGLLKGVAEWLVGKGSLTASHCPVKAGPIRNILNTEPVDQKGRTFKSYAKVGDFFLYKAGPVPFTIDHVRKLVAAAGRKNSDFRVRFGN